MRAIRAHFDGRQIVLPTESLPAEPGDVIVVFKEGTDAKARSGRDDWEKAQEEAFAKIWNNPDDEIYDHL